MSSEPKRYLIVDLYPHGSSWALILREPDTCVLSTVYTEPITDSYFREFAIGEYVYVNEDGIRTTERYYIFGPEDNGVRRYISNGMEYTLQQRKQWDYGNDRPQFVSDRLASEALNQTPTRPTDPAPIAIQTVSEPGILGKCAVSCTYTVVDFGETDDGCWFIELLDKSSGRRSIEPLGTKFSPGPWTKLIGKDVKIYYESFRQVHTLRLVSSSITIFYKSCKDDEWRPTSNEPEKFLNDTLYVNESSSALDDDTEADVEVLDVDPIVRRARQLLGLMDLRDWARDEYTDAVVDRAGSRLARVEAEKRRFDDLWESKYEDVREVLIWVRDHLG